MTLKNYENFAEQRDETRVRENITSTKQLRSRLQQLSEFQLSNQNHTQKRIFRGVPEASFRMFNSAQRYYLNQNRDISYTDWMNDLLSKVKRWNHEILRKYLKGFGGDVDKNDIAYYSIMQHYGLPTPLLDFTRDPFVALYFASRDADKCYFNNDYNDIRNYFSFYHINASFLEGHGLAVNVGSTETSIDLLDEKIYLIENESVIRNNLNIVAQEGIFLLNTSPERDLINVLRRIPGNGEDSYFPGYNIHKSCARKLKLILKEERGIEEEALFPNLNEFKNDFFNE